MKEQKHMSSRSREVSIADLRGHSLCVKEMGPNEIFVTMMRRGERDMRKYGVPYKTGKWPNEKLQSCYDSSFRVHGLRYFLTSGAADIDYAFPIAGAVKFQETPRAALCD
jgi:hypothetical protein